MFERLFRVRKATSPESAVDDFELFQKELKERRRTLSPEEYDAWLEEQTAFITTRLKALEASTAKRQHERQEANRALNGAFKKIAHK